MAPRGRQPAPLGRMASKLFFSVSDSFQRLARPQAAESTDVETDGPPPERVADLLEHGWFGDWSSELAVLRHRVALEKAGCACLTSRNVRLKGKVEHLRNALRASEDSRQAAQASALHQADITRSLAEQTIGQAHIIAGLQSQLKERDQQAQADSAAVTELKAEHVRAISKLQAQLQERDERALEDSMAAKELQAHNDHLQSQVKQLSAALRASEDGREQLQEAAAQHAAAVVQELETKLEEATSRGDELLDKLRAERIACIKKGWEVDELHKKLASVERRSRGSSSRSSDSGSSSSSAWGCRSGSCTSNTSSNGGSGGGGSAKVGGSSGGNGGHRARRGGDRGADSCLQAVRAALAHVG